MSSPTIDPDVLEPLRYEIAYLRGKVAVYEKILKDRGYIKEEVERMTKHQWVKQAKEEARLNLTGEDLKKCFNALEAWERNT